MNTETDLAKYISKFLSEYLPYERNMSTNTIASYRDTFVLLIKFMKQEMNIEVQHLHLRDINKTSIVDFIQWLKVKRGCSIATCNNRLNAIHSFAKFLQYEDIAHMDNWQKILTIKLAKSDTKSLNYLTTEGVKLLLEQPNLEYSSGRRDLAIMALLYDTGARVQELVDLTVGSVRIQTTPYTIKLIGKGRKSRVVPLLEQQVSILRKYMEDNQLFEPNKLSHPLFFNRTGGKFTRVGISYILKKYLREAQTIQPELIPQNISCHSLRHSKAMHLLQAGVNIVYIRDILGHVSVKTTEIYAKADSKHKRIALEKAYVDITPNESTDKKWEHNKDLLTWLQGLGK